MTLHFSGLNRCQSGLGCLLAVLTCCASGNLSAQNVILHLKDGDRISGTIISETTNQLVISNAWVMALPIMLSDIATREPTNAAPSRPATATPSAGGAKAPASAKAAIQAPPKASTKLAPKPKGTWHGQIQIGLDAIFSTQNQQDYFGNIKLTYERPYLSDPKEFFRNTSQVDGEYQETAGQESANRVHGSNKSDFDLSKKAYAYGLVGAGYDEIQKIDFQYQVGPGGGVHLIQHKSFVLNVEGGLDYEAQYRNQASNLKTFYLRLAEDFTWNIAKNLTLTENFAFYPDLENHGQFRSDFTSTLSYGFWKNLSLNLTALDQYNTEVAPGVDRNRFEFRSSLGLTF